jgi:hypothetical protein
MRAKPEDQIISLDFVEKLRQMGVSDDTVNFTDHYAARFSYHDLDRIRFRGFLLGANFAAALIGIVLWVLGHPAK